MRLELRAVSVRRVEFGAATALADGCLTVAREELRALVAADPRLREVRVELANPGDDCRITDIFDVFEPRYKPGGPNFPGLLEPVRRAGSGVTAVARGAAVMVLSAMEDRYRMTIDMRGPAADYSRFAHTANVCLCTQPAEGVSQPVYYRALKEAAGKAAAYLGEAAAYATPEQTEIFDLDLHRGAGGVDGKKLPRIAYVYMVASQQRPTEPNEPVIYGDSVRNLLPTVLHPNEVIDGAVLSPFWNFGGETYLVQNHPIIQELYRRHAKDLDFAGVIATIAAETETARTRGAVIAAGLAREVLGADGVVLTKYGGGIPESVVMETLDACEDLGVKGVIVVWTHGGDGRIEGSLTFISPRADAIVSCGINEGALELGPVARVIRANREDATVMESEGVTRPAAGPLRLRWAAVAGAADQLGSSHRSSEEY